MTALPLALAALAAAPADFTRDVVPALTKLGCNAGACHGSFQGRGGFRLSLLGFDPAADFDALTREARGRRVVPAAPDASLLLAKGLAAVPHGGGKRLVAGSPAHRVLRDWVAAGSPGPGPAPPRVVRLEVTPARATLAAGREAPLAVRAVWSDGVAQDATPLALYESTSDHVATVAAGGRVTGRSPGLTAVTVRYMGQVAAVPVTIPYAAPAAAPPPPAAHVVDRHVEDAWHHLGLTPSPPASDAEFLRRAGLDLIGTTPTPDEVRRFLADTSPDKRARLIDALLARPEYVDYWAIKWGDLLRTNRKLLGGKGLSSFNGWLRQALRENRGVDRMVRELLTARGNLYTSGPVAFYYVDKTPEDLAETTAQVFLGVRLACAKCHHHPFEVWGQDDYYGMAAFFAGVRRKDTGDDGAYGGAQSVRPGGTARVVHPATGRPVEPGGLGQPPVPAGLADPRVALADWVTRPDNPLFARNVVNRFWGYLFGRGLVEPIDDLRATNPPSHPALLDELARDFAAHGYDVKRLLRTLATSRAYQLAGELEPGRDAEGRFFASRRPRRLPGEVLLDAVNQAAGTADRFDQVPAGTRAIGLPDPLVPSYFLDAFGRPPRSSNCECERSSRPDLRQALHLANGEAVHQKVTDPKGRVARLLADPAMTDAARVEELYLAALGRPPTAAERATVRDLLAAAPSRKEGFEDLLWSLLNVSEFVFNH